MKRQLASAGVSVPVILITGADKEATRQAALEAGCIAYLEKPFPPDDLIEAIGKAIKSRAREPAVVVVPTMVRIRLPTALGVRFGQC